MSVSQWFSRPVKGNQSDLEFEETHWHCWHLFAVDGALDGTMWGSHGPAWNHQVRSCMTPLPPQNILISIHFLPRENSVEKTTIKPIKPVNKREKETTWQYTMIAPSNAGQEKEHNICSKLFCFFLKVSLCSFLFAASVWSRIVSEPEPFTSNDLYCFEGLSLEDFRKTFW